MQLKRKELFTIAMMGYMAMKEHPENFTKTLPKCEELLSYIYQAENGSQEDEMIIMESPF